MTRPHLLVCTRCEGGEELRARVKGLRRALHLKEVFKVDEVRCLDLCDDPCAVQLEGKARSTLARTGLTPHDAARLVDAARTYARLARGEELAEDDLPGDHAD